MKKILSFVLAVLLVCSTMPFGYAEALEDVKSNALVDDSGDTISTRVEVTEWFFRNNNGVNEKRLWSYTYGKWLTDWIPC